MIRSAVSAAFCVTTIFSLANGQELALDDSLRAALARGEAALRDADGSAALEAFYHAEGLLGMARLYGTESADHDALVELRRGMGRALMLQDDAFGAAAAAARGLDVDEGDAVLWTILGRARYRLGEIEAAAEAFDRAVGLGAASAELIWGQALVAVGRNQLAEALELGTRAHDQEPTAERAIALARWSEVAGDHAAAADWLDAALAIDPEVPAAAELEGLSTFHRRMAEAPVGRIDPQTRRVQINFDLKSGDEIPYLPVGFNDGEPVYVLLDTGAERNVVDLEFARSVGIDPIDPGVDVRGPYRASPGGYGVVDRLRFGSLLVERVPVAVADFDLLGLRHQGEYFIAGVLNPGLLFREFTVVLDYANRRIELIRPVDGGPGYSERATRLRKTSVPFVFDVNAVWPVIPVSLDGARGLPFIVDTGASDVLIDRRVGGTLRLDPDRVLAAAGGHSEADLAVILFDQPARARQGIATEGILGYPFFRAMRLVFDYPRMELIIEN